MKTIDDVFNRMKADKKVRITKEGYSFWNTSSTDSILNTVWWDISCIYYDGSLKLISGNHRILDGVKLEHITW